MPAPTTLARLRALLAALAVAVTAALTAAGCTTAREFRIFPAMVELDTSPATLPVRWSAGLPIVEATVDGRGPYHLMLDTGASGVALAPRVADELSLRRGPLGPGGDGIRVAGAQGTTARVREAVEIGELRAGPMVLRGVDALVLDVAGIEAASGLRIDGILPATAFHGLLLTFDPAEGRVTVERGSLPPPDGADVLALDDDPLPCVTFVVDGRPCSFLLDSGSTEFLSLPRDLEAGLRYRSPPTETGRWSTIGGNVPRIQARLDGTIAWGRHPLTNPVVSFTGAARGGIGGAALGEFRTTLDMTGRRVRFERDGDAPIRTFPVRGAGVGFLRAQDAWTVAYLLPGRPAEAAGLRVGDRVVAIDDIAIAFVGMGFYEIMLLTQDAMRFRVAGADGATREVVVPVVTLVE